ncbi:hypothetical protein HMPREF9413_5822, partial [Paenibacillus sp. HGF7]
MSASIPVLFSFYAGVLYELFNRFDRGLVVRVL